MSVDVVILLVVAIGCASVAWPASMPTRIRWSFAALSAGLLGTASAIAVADVLDGLRSNGVDNNGAVEQAVNARVRELCRRFPIYQG